MSASDRGAYTTDHWAVSVDRNGENIVTIESNCLSGRSLSKEDERVIRIAAAHLLAFIGDAPPVVRIVSGSNDGEGIFPCDRSETTAGTRRILARVEQLEFEAPELEWINSRTSFLGEHFGMASRSIQALIDDGSMIVVRTERITDG